MIAMKRKIKDCQVAMRLSIKFKTQMERAAGSLGYPSLAEFIRDAVIEFAEKRGKKIERY